jgi:aspartate aminotransferase
MAELLSDRIAKLPESETIAMAQRARELKATGKDIINLSLGEPDFDTPQHIKDAAKIAIDEGYTKYSPVPGYPELKQAIINKFKRDNDLDFELGQIVVSTGAKQSIANAVLCLTNPGDEMILPAPYWVSYSAIGRLAGANIIEIPTDISSDFKIRPEQLEAQLTSNSKVLIFSSPCNPTGSVYSKEELEGLADVIVRYPNLIVISDEIYEYINFTGKHASIASIDSIREQVVTVNGLSKGFSMTGWRLGYLAAPKWLADACTKMQGQFTSGTCSITQRAAITAISGSLEEPYRMRDQFKKRRDRMLELLREIKEITVNEPPGAFYLFPDVRAFFGKEIRGHKIETPSDLCMYLLEEAGVALVTGEAFGDPNCIRISYAASMDELEEAVKRIKEVLS